MRLGAERRHAPGPGVRRGKVGVGRHRGVVAIRLLLARADHERPEHVLGLERESRARHDDRGIAAPAGGERRREPEPHAGVLGTLPCLALESGNLGGRDRSWPGCVGARCREHHQKERELRFHRRDFFFAGFFLGGGFGLAPRTGLCLDFKGPSTSASTRSPSSGPIRPRRTA